MLDIGDLTHPLVRDLAWSVFSEDLVAATHLGKAEAHNSAAQSCRVTTLTAERRDWLRQLDAAPRALSAAVERAGARRLGLYFEALWQFYLTHGPGTTLLAHNLPVRAGGRTLGEFDCLYRDPEGGCVHLELAVKLYLCTRGLPGVAQTQDARADWLGPGCRDRLDRKLDRLSEHQLGLSRQPAAQRLLAERELTPTRCEAVVRGRLFRNPMQDASPPPGFPCGGSLFSWYRLSDVDRERGIPMQGSFALLPRLAWLAPLKNAEARGDITLVRHVGELHQLLSARMAQRDAPDLVAALDERGSETTRFFVVPETWPR
jgi:hypothetical protein